MKKKVLYVAHENTKGGATHSLINIIDSLPNNISPYILIPKKIGIRSNFSRAKKSLIRSGTLKEEMHRRNIPIIEAYYFYDNLCMKNHLLRYLFFLLLRNIELNKVLKYVNKKKISIIHSNSSVIKFGADIASKGHLKHIWHVREDVKEMFEVNENSLRNYYKNINNKSDNVIFVSHTLKKNFIENLENYGEKIYKEKFKTIYNGIFLSDNKLVKLDKSRNTFNIYCFGTVYNIKGQEDLIRLGKRMEDENITNYTINIVGERKHEYYSHLLNLIKGYGIEDKVNFIDYTNNINQLRKNADVEVVCSRNEAFGRVAIEAMNFGNPLIVTNVGGLDEIVTHEKNGLKYTPGNIDELYNNIKLVLDDDTNNKILIKNAKKRSCDFSIERCVTNICKYY